MPIKPLVIAFPRHALGLLGAAWILLGVVVVALPAALSARWDWPWYLVDLLLVIGGLFIASKTAVVADAKGVTYKRGVIFRSIPWTSVTGIEKSAGSIRRTVSVTTATRRVVRLPVPVSWFGLDIETYEQGADQLIAVWNSTR
jgi:hypothetical protein